MFNVNISIDDISPHPLSSTKVLERCYELIEEFEDIKFTLFVPTSYWRTMPPQEGRPDTRTSDPFQIDLYPEFCEEIKNLPKKNFELGYHGHFHGIPRKSNNDEFQYLSHPQALDRFKLMFDTAEKAGVKDSMQPIFRPPAWRMSADSIRAAKELGIEILALSAKPNYKQTYGGEDDNFENVVYYNVNPPFDPLTLCSKTEIVYHACEWDKNFLDKDKTEDLRNFLKKNEEKIDFCFMREL